MKFLLCFFLLLLTACAPITKHPFGGVGNMSADTLCYRATYGTPDPSVLAEIKARNLDCAAEL